MAQCSPNQTKNRVLTRAPGDSLFLDVRHARTLNLRGFFNHRLDIRPAHSHANDAG